ncbi:MAG TPA: hypothetical protein VF395_21630, partial [Polyangiaceae bacterium]
MRPYSRSSLSLVAVIVAGAGSVVVSASCSSPNEISLLGESPDARRPGSGGGAASGGGGGLGGDVGLTTDAAPGCRTAADCTFIAPFCDAKSGACLECVTDSNCSTYLCDPVAHVCMGCTKATDCHSATPYCDADDHRCIQCLSRADCAL